jgi:hypothetical protein
MFADVEPGDNGTWKMSLDVASKSQEHGYKSLNGQEARQ